MEHGSHTIRKHVEHVAHKCHANLLDLVRMLEAFCPHAIEIPKACCSHGKIEAGTLHVCTTSSFGAAELHHLVGVTESESNCSDGASRVSICCVIATQVRIQLVERMLPELKAGRRVKPGRRGQFRKDNSIQKAMDGQTKYNIQDQW